ncbi:CDP-diacylglycerol--inositol 3-phosphatidyltransferase-like [Argonauta hians]
MSSESIETIFLFVPNLIDYGRVVFAFAAFYFMQTNYQLAAFLYLLSGFLDSFDGHAARVLNQGSKLGAMLDQLIDRFTTMCLMAALCFFYPKYMLLFQFSMTVDIVSHWFHLQSSLMKGSGSHKVLDLSANPVLRHYYHNKIILFLMCAGNELFYCLLYVRYFTPGPTVFAKIGLVTALLYPCALIALLKTIISILQLYSAMANVAAIDVADRAALRAGENKKSS